MNNKTCMLALSSGHDWFQKPLNIHKGKCACFEKNLVALLVIYGSAANYFLIVTNKIRTTYSFQGFNIV